MLDRFVTDQWTLTHAALGLSPDVKVFDQLVETWGGDGRFYHSLSHLSHGLRALEPYGDEVALVRLAWFFHDAIYVVGRGDNEQKSADWFAAYTRERGLGSLEVERGAGLILMTKDHQGAITDDPLWPIMNDVDLGVFAASRQAYDTYAANVWGEYQAVATRRQFVLGRAAFMEAFKARPIFLTEAMKASESAARENIDAEIARLQSEARDAGWLTHDG